MQVASLRIVHVCVFPSEEGHEKWKASHRFNLQAFPHRGICGEVIVIFIREGKTVVQTTVNGGTYSRLGLYMPPHCYVTTTISDLHASVPPYTQLERLADF